MKSEKREVAVVVEAKKKGERHGISSEVLDALLQGGDAPDDLTGPEGLLKRLTAALVERVLDAELTEHPSPCRGTEVAASRRSW